MVEAGKQPNLKAKPLRHVHRPQGLKCTEHGKGAGEGSLSLSFSLFLSPYVDTSSYQSKSAWSGLQMGSSVASQLWGIFGPLLQDRLAVLRAICAVPMQSGQVWEHAGAACRCIHFPYSRGLRLDIPQADSWPITISLRCRSTCCNHEARGRPIGLLHSRDSLAERIW